MSYGYGVVDSSKIIDGSEYTRATFAKEPSDCLRYLRRVGEYVFLYDPKTHAAELYKLDDIQPLKLSYVVGRRTTHREPIEMPAEISALLLAVFMVLFGVASWRGLRVPPN